MDRDQSIRSYFDDAIDMACDTIHADFFLGLIANAGFIALRSWATTETIAKCN